MRKKITAVVIALAVAVSMSAFVIPSSADAASSAIKKPVMYLNVQSKTSIKVKWSKVKGATKYGIYMSKPSTDKYTSATVSCKLKKTLSKQTTSYTIKGLKSGKHYAVLVTAGKFSKSGKLISSASCSYRDIKVTLAPEILDGFPTGNTTSGYIPIVIYNQSKYSMVMIKNAEYYPDTNTAESVTANLSKSVTIKPGTKTILYYYFDAPQSIDGVVSGIIVNFTYNGKAYYYKIYNGD